MLSLLWIMKKHIFFCFIVGLFICQLSAQQYKLSGVVVDSVYRTPIQYANIWIGNQEGGTISDQYGAFSLAFQKKPDTLFVSCIGYNKRFVVLRNEKFLNIELSPSTQILPTFSLSAKDNPAFRIIRNVRKHKSANNMKQYRSYKADCYTKTFFSSDIILDSLTHARFLDTLQILSPTDSFALNLLNKQHLFMMESVFEHYYKAPSRHYDKLTASKISGFSNPIFHLITSHIQNFSFYDTYFTVLGRQFENPIADEKFSHYDFYLEDIFFDGKDSLFTIAFQPKKNKDFAALSGKFVVSSDKWAIVDVLTSPVYESTIMNIVVHQKYTKIDDKYWFPEDIYSKMTLNIPNLFPFSGYFYSTYSNVAINIPLQDKIFFMGNLNAGTNLLSSSEKNKLSQNQSDSLLAIYRTDTLSNKDSVTYFVWDSLTKNKHLDKYEYVIKSLISGNIPIHMFDLDITRFFAFNKYEACRIGFGLHTNDRLSKWMSVGGFFGYGFRDERVKAGFDANFSLYKQFNTNLFFGLTYDLQPAGSTFESQFLHKYSFSLKGLNQIASRYYDNIFKGEIGISSYVSKYIMATLGFSFQKNHILYNYKFTPITTFKGKYFNYELAQISLHLRLSFSEIIYSSDMFTLTKDDNLPIIEFSYQRGINGFANSDFAFNGFALKVRQSIKIPYIGLFSYTFRAALIDADLPLASLYANHGTYMAFGFYAKHTFATMLETEFLSDKFLSLYASMRFKRLYKTRYSSPQPELLLGAAVGGLRHPEYHQGINFKTMEKGYFETGLVVHRILKYGIVGIGAGIYWRFGKYHFARESDNFSARLSITFGGE